MSVQPPSRLLNPRRFDLESPPPWASQHKIRTAPLLPLVLATFNTINPACFTYRLGAEGWPRHKKKGPVPKWHGRGGRLQVTCGMRFETWCVSDHPVCGASVQPPPPHEEGNLPGLRLFVQRLLHHLPSVVDEGIT